MLFIYRSLAIGGIETFFVRMAKERNKNGLNTKILLFSQEKDNDPTLLSEMRKYAEVVFAREVLLEVPLLTKRVPVVVPIKRAALRKLLIGVEQIHVSLGVHALLGHRFTNELGLKIPITVGVYHYIAYLWGGEDVSFNVKVERDFIFSYLPKEALLFFSEDTRDLYQKKMGRNFAKSNTFRIGVVDRKEFEVSGELPNTLKVVAVGRLVEFKTYNLYMLGVIKNLSEKGFQVQLDIFGSGPLRSEMLKIINKLGIQNRVCLKGNLDYNDFDNTIKQYDIFIGSGTAIIQAAALGVPAIVGVENVNLPESYGYFCHVYNYEYNFKGAELPLVSVEQMLEKFIALSSEERLNLKKLHMDSINNFTNASSHKSFTNLNRIKMPSDIYNYNRVLYSISLIWDGIGMLLNKKHPFNMRHKALKNDNQ